MPERCSALILAGGLSTRMHFPKAYLLYRQSTFAEKIIGAYLEAGITHIYIVLNHGLCMKEWARSFEAMKKHATVILNHHPEWGRSYSLLLGLSNMMPVDFCFMQNVDNPFVDAELIATLFKKRNSKGSTVPAYLGRRGHPVVLSKLIIQEIVRENKKDFNVKDLLQKYPQTNVEVSTEEILLNINTHEDYFNFLNKQTA